MARVHKRFDLDHWIREFPIAEARRRNREQIEQWAREDPRRYESQAAMEEHIRQWQPAGELIVGPESMALTEQLRREAGAVDRLGRGVPVDVMVWGEGEPANPAATKIGGLPYRPADAPWPTGREGGPSEFYAQICFADSHDIVRDARGRQVKLPGDVLLIFAPGFDGIWDSDEEDPTCLQYEWWPLGLSNLLSMEDLPERALLLKPCHAELHRTMDYPEAPEDHPLFSCGSPERLCVFEGGKIGGVPLWVQSEDPRPGTFIAAIGSINPVGRRFPLLNVPENPSGEFNMEGSFLMFGDCGSLYLFHSARGLVRKQTRLHWTVQGY